MTKTPAKSLYNQDFALWVIDTVTQLKKRNFHEVDWENLIEEVEFLVRRERRELESRLVTLFEHILKRRYVPLVDCYRGWENTIKRTQKDLKKLLKDSPSLRNYFLEILTECYADAVDNLINEYDVNFPNVCPFSEDEDIDILLNHQSWENI
ncbi:DUF29 domain-containing protein [Anabaena sp. FACHB-1237]|uniref:DUF29 domain-containing protein n=1 Tax=Anabaena sp. FACHB-1237 TaxID=2692769 RepID=UPI0016808893|nr:DUF29 domain-containing protein [Anabaena sp. FACHB-1237]MBD2139200.1 DUF29 domain-containing protein [Anabaena sp. FACHB-1237]